MAWIEVHQALRDHRKVWALAAELDMPEAHVSGHVIYLWLWALDNAQDGCLPPQERIIERAAGWTGKPGELVRALITAGFIDKAEDGCLYIHDWEVYTGRLIGKRKADAERKRNERASTGHPTDIQRTSNGHPMDGARTNTTVPTEPNHTHDGEYPRESNITPFAPVANAPDAQPQTPQQPQKPKRTTSKPAPKDETPAATPAPSKSNPHYDALCAEFYTPTTKPERSNFGRIVSELKAAGATPEDIRRRCANHRTMLERGQIRWDLTPNALVTHWTELREVAPARAAPVSGPRPTGTEGPSYSKIARL